MSDLVAITNEVHVVQVTPEPDISVSVTPPPPTTLVVNPSEGSESVVVVQEGDIQVRVAPEPSVLLYVTAPSDAKTLVVTGGRAVRATSVAHLSDVDTASGFADGATLVYDQATEMWIPKTGQIQEALDLHVNSPTPHPAYDAPDGPSLLLLYQNAKV